MARMKAQIKPALQPGDCARIDGEQQIIVIGVRRTRGRGNFVYDFIRVNREGTIKFEQITAKTEEFKWNLRWKPMKLTLTHD
jgi:hypothetical protein